MKERRKGGGCVSLIIIAPLLLIGIGLLVAGLRTGPEALTEDGHSLRGFLLIAAAAFLAVSAGIGLFSLVERAGSRMEVLQQQEIEATHREGAAQIERIQPGTQLGNEAWKPVLLTLKVVLPGKSPYEVIWDGTVEETYAGQLRPREWLRVLVSPSNPQKIYIQWGEAAKIPDPAR
jgi:hypothetical protein